MLKLVAIAIASIAIMALAAVIGFRRDIDRDVKRLVSSAEPGGALIVTEAMLTSLPAPAQRYFRFAGVIERRFPGLSA